MMKKIREFFQKKDSEKGQGVVEYAMIIGFAAILALAFFNATGVKTQVETDLTNVSDSVKKVSTGVKAVNDDTTITAGGGATATSP